MFDKRREVISEDRRGNNRQAEHDYDDEDLDSGRMGSNDSSWEGEDSDSDSLDDNSSGSLSVVSFDEIDDTFYRPPSDTMRRRGGATARHADEQAIESDQQRGLPTARERIRPRHRRRRHSIVSEFCELAVEELRRICRERSSLILLCSFLFWLVVQLGFMNTESETAYTTEKKLRFTNHDSQSSFGRAAVVLTKDAKDGFFSLFGQSRHRKNMEELPQGCVLSDWQKLSFPTCNRIHEIDLGSELGIHHNNGIHSRQTRRRYIGSGLWRDVWRIPSHEGGEDYVVLKLMKGEHDVDSRNLDRHRRDAMTMERLTASRYIVSIYGHCGNTVLTEYIVRSLDKIIYDNLEDRDLLAAGRTRSTPLGRLRLSLDVARGVAAMHAVPGGPIIHADIQAKQFLVDSDGTVKLNDFNRCRFMARSNTTVQPCPVRIPTAPGRNRAPEEYEIGQLTEKIDIYSTAHILFGILTGQEPWKDYRGSQVKDMVKRGTKPAIEAKFIVQNSTDAVLAMLIDASYELDPDDRLSATQLVEQLEDALAREKARPRAI
jgi:serine/threonine protein kinase